MKRILIILTLLTLSLTFSFGQAQADSITMKKVFGGYQFIQEGKVLKVNQLVKTMESNAIAYKEIKTAKSTYTIATIFGAAGGFMVGWPIGTAIAGGDANWLLAGIGSGLIVVAIPISKKFNSQAKQAVGTYNNGIQTSSFWDKRELSLSMCSNGVGLILNF